MHHRVHAAALVAGLTILATLYLHGVTLRVAGPGGPSLLDRPLGPLSALLETAGSGSPEAASPASTPDAGSPPTPAPAEGEGRPPLPLQPTSQPVPLTTGKTMDGFPDWAPDGRRIAFMRGGRIALIPARGGEPFFLGTGANGWEVAPAWDPQGRRIAFIRYGREGAGKSTVVLREVNTQGEETLLELPGAVGYLAWSPDGGSLAFSVDSQVAVLNLRTREVQTLVQADPETDLLAGGLSWSPDGQWLVYGAGQKGQGLRRYNLYQVAATGGTPRALTSEGGLMPHVAPDGRRVAFRRPDPAGGVAVLDLETGKTASWARDTEKVRYFHPRWSPDGRSLVMARLGLTAEGGSVHLRSHLVVVR